MRLEIMFVVLWVGVARGISDIEALLKFKEGIKEDPLHRIFSSWNHGNLSGFDGCPLGWYGVQCSGIGISSITLNDMGLVGNVSFSSLAGMEILRHLSLSNNHLTGILSPEVASISSLEFLDLSGNSFVGPIPIELEKLGKLSYLNLSSNKFEGSVPSAFEKLTQLKHLDLHGNNFSGDLEGILAQLQSVVHVDLSQNQFSGSLKSISDKATIATSLQYLNISHNAMFGELFAKGLLPLFDSLEVFDASFNQLTGSVPPFNFIVSLKILRLGSNHFSGSLPRALLEENSMVLNELDLSCNQLSGPITSITSGSLKHLNFSTNQLSGSLPARVGSCSVVDLSNNKLSGNLSTVKSWGNNVEVIDLSSNMITGTLPNETSRFLRLISFKASSNLLAGELPLVIGTYPELNVIDLSLNMLSGPLPSNLFTTLRLRDLNLSGNSFTGQIPFPGPKMAISVSSDASFIAQNLNLVSLDLSDNSFNGSLPPEIGTMTDLKLLKIGRNNISGQIPKEIGMLHLNFLDLSSNHFEGSIPDHLSDSLVEFNVSYNNLSGKVPANLMRFPDSSFHPGNSLLIFPHVPTSNGPILTDSGKHGHHMKNAILYIVIVGVVACVSMIVVSILLYCKVSNGNIGRDDTNQHKSPITNLFGLWKSPDPPPASLSLSHDQLLQSRSISMPLEHEDISSSVRESAEPEIQLSSKVGQSDHGDVDTFPPKNEGNSSVSLVVSSPPSYDPYLAKHPSLTSVSSPDRLAGDLHLFDDSGVFTAEQLSRAPSETIGRSCHGTSYKATLDSGHILTVKCLREGITKGKKEFSREAKKLGNIKHPNILLLRGYYWGPKEHERLIISDYIDVASLTVHLCDFESRNLLPLSLSQRLKIAVDIARALTYLHNERSIPHGNLKSTNILIQLPNLNALLTDFSLHRILTPAGMADQVLNSGALGYRPPEFVTTSKPSPSLKGDVYAFGVILIELLTGKSAGEIISGNPGLVDLTDWVRLLASQSRSYECFDQLIVEADGSEGPPDTLEQMLRIGLDCIGPGSERPEIRTVFRDLSSMAS